MEFHPSNPIVQICLKAQTLESNGDRQSALRELHQSFEQASNDFEKYLLCYFIAKMQNSDTDRLHWLNETLAFANKVDALVVKSAYPNIYTLMAQSCHRLGQIEEESIAIQKAIESSNMSEDKGPFYHGTKANLQLGDVLTPGFKSNYHSEVVMNHIYFTAVVNGAALAAELAQGDNEPRVFIVEPQGDFENDPNVTDKKFPGNPTRSYRSTKPIKIIGEVKEWDRMGPEQLKAWKDKLSKYKREDIIN